MAVVAVAFDGTRVNDSEALGTVWRDYGGTAAVLEPDFLYQGTYSVSEKVKQVRHGVKYYDSGTTNDFSTTPKTAIYKVMAVNYSVLNVEGANGGILSIGSGDVSNYYDYYVVGGDTYPITGGWLIIPIDPNINVYDYSTGTPPTLTAVDFYSWTCDFTANSKAENVAMDAIDFIDNGTGLTLTAGTSTDPDGDFQDFIDFDEGDYTKRYGIVSTKQGVLYVTGVLTVGTSTETDFTDSNQVLIFPGGRFDTGFCGVDIGLQHASSVIDMSAITLVGKGSDGEFVSGSDTRPDWGTTGTSGAATLDGMSFQSFNDIVFTSAVTVTSSSFVQSGNVNQSGATISTSTFDNMGDAASILSDDPEAISSCTFISDGSNHAFEADTTGTYDFIGHTFTGYATTPPESPGSTGNEVFYNNSGGLITLNASDITGIISVRNEGASTTTVNNNVAYTITIQDEGAVAIVGAQVAMFKTSDDSVLHASSATNGSGQVTGSVASGTGAVYIRVRQSNTADSPRYYPTSTVGTISTTTFSVTITMIEDTTVT